MPPLSDRQKATLSAYEIFETDAGKAVLEDLEKSFCDLSYVPGAMDYKAGMAEVVRQIRLRMEMLSHPERVIDDKPARTQTED